MYIDRSPSVIGRQESVVAAARLGDFSEMPDLAQLVLTAIYTSEDCGVTNDEFHELMLKCGQTLLQELDQGIFGHLLPGVWESLAFGSFYYGINWSDYGLSHEQVSSRLLDQAVNLFTRFEDQPDDYDAARHILWFSEIRKDWDWDAVLGVGACQRLAEAAHRWIIQETEWLASAPDASDVTQRRARQLWRYVKIHYESELCMLQEAPRFDSPAHRIYRGGQAQITSDLIAHVQEVLELWEVRTGGSYV